MVFLSSGFLLSAALLLVLGAKWARGRPFFVNAKLLYTAFLLLLFLPFPLWLVQALHVAGSTAAFSAALIVAFGCLLLWPVSRMPRTSAVFNVDRDRAAALLREILERHRIACEVSAPHPGGPVRLRDGFAFLPREGWRFSFARGAHVLVGRLPAPSVALLCRVSCGDVPGLEEALSLFRRSLSAEERKEGVPPGARLLLVTGGILFLLGAAAAVLLLRGG